MRLRPSTLPSHRRGSSGADRPVSEPAFPASFLLHVLTPDLGVVETRVLILNADPVFEDRALAILDENPALEIQIVRNLSETVSALLGENFDGLIIEGEGALALEQATHVRQHFPSLTIACLLYGRRQNEVEAIAREQNIELLPVSRSDRRLRASLTGFVRALDSNPGTAAEGIDPCHSLIGNLNQFSAAEILQMSCLSQRSGRFTFKSGRGNSEIYLQQGAVRHAVFGSLEGEAAVAEIFRWRQGRFYFEEGIISQEQTVNRPWAHLLIDNLQKLDETLELVSV
jgi:hypothetical protein